jgi:hypothetical protein
MDALIGGSGFVGSHLLRPSGLDVYTSTTIDSIRGKQYETIYCAGLYAEKWKANKDPATDRASMHALMDALQTVSCSRFVLLSTIDVYDARLPQCETPDVCPNVYATHPYGAHRREMEEWVLRTFPDVYIVRLPALFGPGLKKNALFDLMHGHQTDALRSHWVFQWYDIRWLRADLDRHIERKHRIVNLVTPPISLGLVQTLLFPTRTLSSDPTPAVSYAFTSQYGYAHSLEEVLMALTEFVRAPPSRLMVSELGWSREDSKVRRAFLRAHRLEEEGVPSKWNWELRAPAQSWYSVQSLLYGVTIQIFQEQDRFLSLLADRFAALASAGVQRVVFGSPTQRHYSGEDAVGLFRRVGDLAAQHGLIVCIEHVSAVYGATWLTTLREAAEFVAQVDHPSIAVNLDTGSMLLEQETVIPPTARIGHVQISFPHLRGWMPEVLPQIHALLAQIPSYTGRISLESRESTLETIQAFAEEFAPWQRSP